MYNEKISDLLVALSGYLKFRQAMGLDIFCLKQRGKADITPDLRRTESRNAMYRLSDILKDMGNCRRCKLHGSRKNIVFGTGNEKAQLVLVGEGPGYDEDVQGEPFVGAAGQLLNRILAAINLKREDVYICNIVKCRPPGNRNPEQDEIDACSPYLLKQLEIIRPRLICALGSVAAQTLLKTTLPIGQLRGCFHDFQGTKLMPTYHPAYLLRNPSRKREVWHDMQLIQKEYEYS